ncbi:hypothetical protein DPX16_5234 [Anabarilius grahami]|uniref:Uncharacterized protein n=1 Tax=Anabarilius grahami TaxID=495550 RepID=A0A3N0Y278_ANAGA|nr:hypothetical protein DPX16_5234 [Anabarilius grahami]
MQSTNSEYGSPYLATCHFTSLTSLHRNIGLSHLIRVHLSPEGNELLLSNLRETLQESFHNRIYILCPQCKAPRSPPGHLRTACMCNSTEEEIQATVVEAKTDFTHKGRFWEHQQIQDRKCTTVSLLVEEWEQSFCGDIAALSFTASWSSDISPTSMRSLTAQWIRHRFQAKKGVQPSALTNVFDNWCIDRSKVQ